MKNISTSIKLAILTAIITLPISILAAYPILCPTYNQISELPLICQLTFKIPPLGLISTISILLSVIILIMVGFGILSDPAPPIFLQFAITLIIAIIIFFFIGFLVGKIIELTKKSKTS